MNHSKVNIPLIGGLIAAVGAGLCCARPLVLLLLGISGSWISSLTLLEPVRPYFIGAVVLLFSWSAWKVFKPINTCTPGSACADPSVNRRRKIIFCIAIFVAIAFVLSPYWIMCFVE